MWYTGIVGKSYTKQTYTIESEETNMITIIDLDANETVYCGFDAYDANNAFHDYCELNNAWSNHFVQTVD